MVYNLFDEIILEQLALKTTALQPLVNAVKNRKRITFDYYGPLKPKKDSVLPGRRVNVEPVAIGLSKKNNMILRGYVPSNTKSKKGFNKTNWRTFLVSRMRNLQVSNETFEKRPTPYKEGPENANGPMKVTYLSVDWKTTPKQVNIKPKPKPLSTTKEKMDFVKQLKTKPTNLPQPNQNNNQNKKTELPQPKPKETPPKTPEEDNNNNNNNITEGIKRIKTLIYNY
jgi:hypothetical protein